MGIIRFIALHKPTPTQHLLLPARLRFPKSLSQFPRLPPPMGSLFHPVSLTFSPRSRPPPLSRPLKPPSSSTQKPPTSRSPSLSIPKPRRPSLSPSNDAGPTEEEEEEEEPLVEPLKVPDSWLLPSKALQESEWLRVTLHKWLDDEYCPEPANVEISKVAARSYYESLIAKKTDLGEILLNMVGDLKNVSFQESFHGVFSSANAAVHLITLRMNSVEEQ